MRLSGNEKGDSRGPRSSRTAALPAPAVRCTTRPSSTTSYSEPRPRTLHDRRRPQPSGRSHRPYRRAPHLGLGLCCRRSSANPSGDDVDMRIMGLPLVLLLVGYTWRRAIRESKAQRLWPRPMPRIPAFHRSALSVRFIFLAISGRGVRAFECALSSRTSSLVQECDGLRSSS